jgi:uncharacterized protein YndB with AHSA1/START domain
MFSFFTSAASFSVWATLTDAAQIRQYLDGLALRSTWSPGSPIVAPFRERPTVMGEVLCAQLHHRLSYVIHPPAATAVYLTWLLRDTDGGCVCTLQVDEAEATEPTEREDVWLPIVAALQRVLTTLPNA